MNTPFICIVTIGKYLLSFGSGWGEDIVEALLGPSVDRVAVAELFDQTILLFFSHQVIEL